MSPLALQQQALLRALWHLHPQEAFAALAPHLADAATPGALRGLRAYRSNGRALAQRALAGAYPVVAQLLGEENFAALAHALWLRHPPLRGDIALWGAALPACIDATPQLASEEPYLADVARIEWALHVAATAADGVPDAGSLMLLARHPPARLRLALCAGAACIASAWPAASIVLAHLGGEPTLAQAGERLRAGIAETALVWRAGLRPRVRLLDAGEAPFVGALLQGADLQAARDAAPPFDFPAWLAQAAQSGLVLGALLDSTEHTP